MGNKIQFVLFCTTEGSSCISFHRLLRNQLVVPSVKLSTYVSRSVAFSGPTVWNKLPDYLRNPSLSVDIFNRDLKTFLFATHSVGNLSVG